MVGSVLAGRHGQSVGAGGASCCGCVLGRHVLGVFVFGACCQRDSSRECGCLPGFEWHIVAQPCDMTPRLGPCVVAMWVQQDCTLRMAPWSCAATTACHNSRKRERLVVNRRENDKEKEKKRLIWCEQDCNILQL